MKIIIFKKPKRSNYHYCTLDSKFQCPPIKRGNGCYGDCFDCFSKEIEVYNKLIGILRWTKQYR